MRLAADAGVPVPEVLLLDTEGKWLGTPSIVMSNSGRPVFLPDNLERWVRGLAGAMKSVHRVMPETYDLSYLNPRGSDYVARELSPPAGSDPGDSLAKECYEVLRSRIEEINWLPLCLVHFDFWPGNVLWRRNRVSAIVDWPSARPGDLRFDLAQCRLDIALLLGTRAADSFLDAYAADLSVPLQHLWFFDLFLGLRALAHFEDWWMPAYRDLGLPLTSEDVAGRAREFLQVALKKAKST
jgi:aminoglycoside phosphotransferase (APT) family kinase protein